MHWLYDQLPTEAVSCTVNTGIGVMMPNKWGLDTEEDLCYNLTEETKSVINSRSARSGFYRRTE